LLPDETYHDLSIISVSKILWFISPVIYQHAISCNRFYSVKQY